MRIDRILTAALVVLVSTAIVGFSTGSTGASFTASTTNSNESWATSNVAAPASVTATSAIAGRIDLAWGEKKKKEKEQKTTNIVFLARGRPLPRTW